MLTPFPSATAVALALGARLTLRGSTLRRNPWTFGARVSHPRLRYSCQHSHFRCLQHPSRDAFAGLRNAPLPLRRTEAGRQRRIQTCRPDWQARPLQHPRDICHIRRATPPQVARRYSQDQRHSAAITASRPTADRHPDKAGETPLRVILLGQSLRPDSRRWIWTPGGVGRPSALLDPPGTAGSPDAVQARPIGTLKHLHVFERAPPLALAFEPICTSVVLASGPPKPAASVRGLSPVTFSAPDGLIDQ